MIIFLFDQILNLANHRSKALSLKSGSVGCTVCTGGLHLSLVATTCQLTPPAIQEVKPNPRLDLINAMLSNTLIHHPLLRANGRPEQISIATFTFEKDSLSSHI